MRTARETGSAYLIVLLSLVVLSILGLSLVLIAQTEMQIGTNERILNRTFFAADSGLGIATARVLVTADFRGDVFVLQDDQQAGTQNIGEIVDQSPFLPILDAPCNLCTINQGSDFYEMNHAVTVRANRVTWSGTTPDEDSPVLSQRTVGAMFELQPWQPTAEAYEALGSDEADKIKF